MIDSTRSSQTSRTRPTRVQTRERVLEVAAKLFEKNGFDKTSLDDVAAQAGLTKGAVYSNFAGKDALFAELVVAQIRHRLDEVSKEAGSAQDIAGIAAATGRAMTAATLGDSSWHVAFIEFWTRAMRNPKLRDHFALERRAARQTVASYITEQFAALGATPPLSAERLATVILALSNGLAIEQLIDPEQADETLLAETLRLVLTATSA